MLLSNSFRLSTLDLLSFQFFWDVIFSSWVNVSWKSKWIQYFIFNCWAIHEECQTWDTVAANSMKEWWAKWEGPLKLIIICSPCQSLVGVNPVTGHVWSSARPAPLPHTRPPCTTPLTALPFLHSLHQPDQHTYVSTSLSCIWHSSWTQRRWRHHIPEDLNPGCQPFLPTHGRTAVDHNTSATFNRNWISFLKCITSRSVNVLQHDGHLKLALLVASRSSVSILFLIRSNLYFTTLTNVWKM